MVLKENYFWEKLEVNECMNEERKIRGSVEKNRNKESEPYLEKNVWKE